jgi:hypothetical protein
VLIDALAQVELDVDRDLAGDQAADDGEAEPEDSGTHDREGQRQQVRPLVALDRVDRIADQQRDQHRHPHREPREDQRADHGAAVRAKEAE